MKSLLQLLRAMLDDVKRLMPEVQGLDRDYFTIEHRSAHEGTSFFTVTLPLICDALDRGLADGRFTCPTNFCKVSRSALPKLFSGLLRKVFGIDGSLLSEPSVEAVKSLRELTRLCKKLSLSSTQEEILDVRAKEGFIQDDASCAVTLYDYDDRFTHILRLVSRQVLLELDDFDESELMCKHGPGAVSEGFSSNNKWVAICNHSELLEKHGLDCIYGSIYNYGRAVSIGLATGGYNASARLVTVPKNSTSRRTITIEPVEFQFVQQGYNTHLRHHIARCDVLGQCLTLDDQSANRQLAETGSQSGYWATLDLKSASDLLSLKLVEHVFHGRPKFLDGILSCRSSLCQTGLESNPIIKMRKYAGMGNATTFPVQSVCFAIIAICSQLADRPRILRRDIVEAASRVRVYGDDIIVPSHCAESTIKWIEAFGLRVNRQKSFWTGRFRESCGLDAYMGVSVTPIYLRHDPQIASCNMDASALSSIVSTSNQLWLNGLYKAAEFLRSKVDAALRRLPLVRQDSGALGWHTRLNATTISHWNRRLHRFEYTGITVRSVCTQDRISGYPALLKFFVTSRSSRQDDLLVRDAKHLERSPRRFLTKIARKRLPSW